MPIMPRPPPVPEMILEEYHAAEQERGREMDTDPDHLRDESLLFGRRAWLAVLLAVLGIAGLFVLLYWIAGVL